MQEDPSRHPSEARFHRWRKRAKYDWYHLRLIRGIWKPVMNARRDEAARLGEALGDLHDLQVLRRTLQGESDRFGSLTGLTDFLRLIDSESQSLRRTARPLGRRLFAIKPKRQIRLWRAWWEEWKDGA
jgi:hypothetical protein